jgi:hypothetical protein
MLRLSLWTRTSGIRFCDNEFGSDSMAHIGMHAGSGRTHNESLQTFYHDETTHYNHSHHWPLHSCLETGLRYHPSTLSSDHHHTHSCRLPDYLSRGHTRRVHLPQTCHIHDYYACQIHCRHARCIHHYHIQLLLPSSVHIILRYPTVIEVTGDSHYSKSPSDVRNRGSLW